MVDAPRRPRCFVPYPGKFDCSKAAEHGDVVQLFDGRAPSFFNVPVFSERVQGALDRHKFDPDVDFVVASGPVIPLMLVWGWIIARHGRARLLLFSADQEHYRAERVPALPGVTMARLGGQP